DHYLRRIQPRAAPSATSARCLLVQRELRGGADQPAEWETPLRPSAIHPSMLGHLTTCSAASAHRPLAWPQDNAERAWHRPPHPRRETLRRFQPDRAATPGDIRRDL